MRAGALQKTVASQGAARIEGVLPGVATRLEREATAVIERLEPWSSVPRGPTLEETCRMCLVLARFEQFFRAAFFVLEYVYNPLVDDPSLDEYANRVVPTDCLQDLIRIAPLVIGDHRDLVSATPLILNPTFALSVALGGADADLIASGLLLDWKSTASDRVVKREDVWQIVGYVLADSDDQYTIRSAGISALRRRRRTIWIVDDLLTTLSGGTNRSLAAWRADFAKIASSVATQRRK